MKIKTILVVLMIAFLALPCSAQSENEKMAFRIKQLELEIENLKQKLTLKEQSLKNEYDKKMGEITKDVNSEILKLNTRETKLENVLWIISFLGVVSFFGTWKWVSNSAKKLAEKKYNEFFEKAKTDLLVLVDKKNETLNFKANKAILVLSAPGGDNRFLQNFFLKNGFKTPEFKTLPVADDFDYAKYDLVLFNNDDHIHDKIDLAEIVRTAKRFPDEIVCFYFGSGRLTVDSTKLASANFRSQLYGNLLNALQYQDTCFKART